MTTIPAHLPALMSTAMKVARRVSADRYQLREADWINLEIIWADNSATYHEWRLGPDQVWTHKGPGRLTDTRARIQREGRP